MNKLLIVLLAVCLVSVVSAHTFVKRDAPAMPTADELTAQLNAAKDKIAEITNQITQQISESVNPETIKKNINDFIDVATKTFKPAEEAKPAASTAA